MNVLISTIYKNASEGYLVGGSLRNSLLKKVSYDLDIAMPRELVVKKAKIIAKSLKAACFILDEDMLTYRIVSKKHSIQVDISAIMGKDINEDIKRRDFTVNAFAYPIAKKPTINILKGGGFTISNIKKPYLIAPKTAFKDLKSKNIKINCKTAFIDDPLRMLRLFRISAELGFKISPSAIKKVKENARLIHKSSQERVKDELVKLLSYTNSYEILKLMDKADLLTTLFMDLESQKGCAQCYYGKGGVLEHTLSTVKGMDYFAKNFASIYPKHKVKIKKYLEEGENFSLLKLAAILHDIEKPSTARVIGDRLRFFLHEEKGAKKAMHLLIQLRFSKNNVRLITKIIKEHLRPSNLAANETITDKAMYRFFRDLHPYELPLLILCWADYASYVSEKDIKRICKKLTMPMITVAEGKKYGSFGKTLRHMQFMGILLNKFFDTKKQILKKPLLDGSEVMDLLKIPPSNKVGKILEALKIAEYEGKIKTRTDAKKFIKKLK